MFTRHPVFARLSRLVVGRASSFLLEPKCGCAGEDGNDRRVHGFLNRSFLEHAIVQKQQLVIVILSVVFRSCFLSSLC